MTKTSFYFFDNDFIEHAAKIYLEKQLEAALVFNHQGNLIGFITEREIFTGILLKKKQISEITTEIKQVLIDEGVIDSDLSITEPLYPVIDKKEKVIGYVTKQKLLSKLSEENVEKASRFDAIFNAAHNGIVSIDKKGVITSINPAAEEFAKTTKDKAIGMFLTDVVSPGGLLEVLRTGKEQSEKYQVGKRKYITNRSPIKKNGEVVGAVGVFQDISEIEFISKELESVKSILNELDTVINSSHDAILITNESGDILKANTAFKSVLGLEKLPRHYTDLRDSYIDLSFLDSVIQTKERINVMKENSKKDNTLLITATPVQETDGKVRRIITNIRDITEIDKLRRELEETKKYLTILKGKENNNKKFIAQSTSMQEILKAVKQIAVVDSTVLITGESGVGKEEVANLVHQMSKRDKHPFIKLNCGAIPEALLESELFGYETGAFTGARQKGKEGLFETANKGTIFLDEIGELPLQLQVKLLRVLQEKEVVRVGGVKPKEIDVRILAATNKDLQQLVTEGEFRLDLFYRLNVVPIQLPPLRKRIEDIPLLIAKFKDEIERKYDKRVKFPPEVIRAFISYHWPGNVRELSNIVERLIVTSEENKISVNDVYSLLHSTNLHNNQNQAISVNGIMPLKKAINEVEKQLLERAYSVYKNTRSMAAILQVNQSTVVRKMKKIQTEDWSEKSERDSS